MLIKILLPLLLLLTFSAFSISSNIVPHVNAQEPEKIYLFYGEGCPHCAVVNDFLEKEKIYDNFPIERKEIYFNQENVLLFNSLLSERGFPIEKTGVPALIIGDKVIVGDKSIIKYFESRTEGSITPGDSNQVVPKSISKSLNLTLIAVIGASW